jgi:hypothetical protein
MTSFHWTIDRKFRAWLADEYRNNRFVEGQTYAFNRYSITLLSAQEADAVGQSFLKVENEFSDGGGRY